MDKADRKKCEVNAPNAASGALPSISPTSSNAEEAPRPADSLAWLTHDWSLDGPSEPLSPEEERRVDAVLLSIGIDDEFMNYISGRTKPPPSRLTMRDLDRIQGVSRGWSKADIKWLRGDLGKPIRLKPDWKRGIPDFSDVRHAQSARPCKTAQDNDTYRPTFGASPDTRPTLRQFTETYVRDQARNWKARTFKSTIDALYSKVVPVLGYLRIREVDYWHIAEWYAGPHGCNRTLSVLSALVEHAESLGLRPTGTNPCPEIERRPPASSGVRPSAAEYRRLGSALEALQSRRSIRAALFKFIVITGARKKEAQRLRWDELHGDRAFLRDSKTGPKFLYLSSGARRILESLKPFKNGPFVFNEGGVPLTDNQVNGAWRWVRKQAGFTLHLHDFRHGFASVAIGCRVSIEAVGNLLGHADLRTTMGYVHVEEREYREAAQRIAAHLGRLLGWDPSSAPSYDVVRSCRPKRKKLVRKGYGDDVVRRYRSQAQPLHAFCVQNNLEPAYFHRILVDFNDRRRQRRASKTESTISR